ncbi:glycosyltransferase [Rubellicoccus peritrichatus]|uniref:Glycosyltransferase n=1 Tax=Rubellicoccus peritrichatus TaxID=3080537 RepID=A0AAQ3L9K3_9BACT|nr:glycosyltransferase [Puniceicoccus sp. CR14]WOO42149.1 glycosyltransferase [Puniceicoccus sp. CR14]
MKIAYLFTTFPVQSETFLQRELRLMAKQGVQIQIHSLWKGSQEWEGQKVEHFRHRHLFKLLWELPYWSFRKPNVLRNVLQRLYQHEVHSLQNLGELLMGLGFAIVKARDFSKAPPDLLHGVWATMPATAAWLLNQLTGLPYSMGAHAYDVFSHGGDCLLPAKLTSARLVHTTTAATRRRLLQLGADSERIQLVRRGLDHFPEFIPARKNPSTIRFITVGRMVPKKGFSDQLQLYKKLKEAGISFEARIIGDGGLKQRLIDQRDRLGLQSEVSFVGWLDYGSVIREYAWADAFVFTGKIASNGDRDGLPNVIPEAMACGLVVLTSPVSGTVEAIEDGETGFVCPMNQFEKWLAAVRAIQAELHLVAHIQDKARKWVEENFDNRKNAAALANALRDAVGFCDFPGPQPPRTKSDASVLQMPASQEAVQDYNQQSRAS